MQIKLTDDIPVKCPIRQLPFEHIEPEKKLLKITLNVVYYEKA